MRLVFLIQCGLILCAASQSCWRDTTCTGPREPSFPGPWEQNSHSPSSRIVSPVRILASDDCVKSDFPGPASLTGNGSLLVFDFGQEVGGIVTVGYEAQGKGALGIAFTEARNWTGEWSDSSNGAFGPDGALYNNVTSTSQASYTVPDERLRGGFRYLSLFSMTDDEITINIKDITLEISYQPAWSNLRAYGGYFDSSDALLNRIWYAGAYTLQTNAVPPNSGRQYPLISTGWLNNASLGSNGSSIFVDGSKRDRACWAGDLAIAVPSVLVSTGDAYSVKTSLQMQYDQQTASTGELPMVGPPIGFYGSDTYHMSTLIGTYYYVLHTGDVNFLSANYQKYKSAMTFITNKVDSTNLLNVTGTADWGRSSQGGHNTEANMLLYRVLVTGSSLATWSKDPSSATTWTSLAQALKSAVNSADNNWDPTVGAFKDSDVDGSIHPEDGNSMALYFGAADANYTANISNQLTTNWGPIGAVCPELPGNIVPYVEGYEIKGHLAIRETQRALDLMRRSWGWYLNSPYGTGSSTIEGYLADGSFGYRSTSGYDNDPSYPSHAHGWSTGPTDALTSYVVGLQLTAPGGSAWTLSPQFGDLQYAEGGFTTPLGKFSAKWQLTHAGYILKYDVPAGSTGVLVLPASSNKAPRISIGGQRNTKGSFDSSKGLYTVIADGGQNTVTVAY